MIVKRTEPKPQEVEQQERRQALINEIAKESDDVITLAYMYVKGFQLCGEDITKGLYNAVTNYQTLEAAYRKGYEDALSTKEK